MQEDIVALLIPIFAVIGGFAVAIYGMMRQGRKRELLHEERKIAMERGLPLPKEFKMKKHPGIAHKNAALVNRKAFVILFFIGLAFAWFFPKGDPEAPFMGAILIMLSFAFLIISLFKYKMTQEEEKYFESENDFGAPLTPVEPPVIEQKEEGN